MSDNRTLNLCFFALVLEQIPFLYLARQSCLWFKQIKKCHITRYQTHLHSTEWKIRIGKSERFESVKDDYFKRTGKFIELKVLNVDQKWNRKKTIPENIVHCSIDIVNMCVIMVSVVVATRIYISVLWIPFLWCLLIALPFSVSNTDLVYAQIWHCFGWMVVKLTKCMLL